MTPRIPQWPTRCFAWSPRSLHSLGVREDRVENVDGVKRLVYAAHRPLNWRCQTAPWGRLLPNGTHPVSGHYELLQWTN
jgi:hypothetical protein